MRRPAGLELSDAEGVLLNVLSMKADTGITLLYKMIRDFPARDARHEQQIVGAYISKLNAKLSERKLAVRPGKARRSYRVYVI